MAGHAGTVPMDRRRDALIGAAEFVLAVEAAATTQEGLVATVGKLETHPGVSNVIPARAMMSLDIRHADDRIRTEVSVRLASRAQDIARRRNLSIELRTVAQNPAIVC